MTSELIAITKPFQWILSTFVLAPPPLLAFRNGVKKRQRNYQFIMILYTVYSLVLLITSMWVSYEKSAYVNELVASDDLDRLTNVISVAQGVAVCLVQMVMQVTAFFGYQRLLNIFTNISELEHDIWQRRKYLHKAESYRCRLYGCSGMLLVFQLLPVPYIDFMLTDDEMPLHQHCLVVFFDTLIELKAVEYCVIVQMIYELLLELYNDLQQLRYESIRCNNRNCHDLRRESLYVGLQENQHLLARIWDLVTTVEDYFALSMLVLFLYDGLGITHIMNWTYIRSLDDNYNKCKYIIIRMLIMVSAVINMLIPCWLSQCCIDLYNRFGATLHNLKSNGSDVRLSMCLREYSLQLMHQKLIFTCGGFFDINFKYFGTIILTVTTYVVILIQFKLQSETSTQQTFS